ncbi:MAG TPA: selenoneine biosynthesis selenosugar synthase SenB [Usitatibacter sp.]
MVSPAKPVVCIVTPGTKSANNGNWRTAARWAEMLRDRFKVIVQSEWDGTHCDAMIALHARRSATSIARFAANRASPALAVVLTGTDLYRDLPRHLEVPRSLDAARRIVVLQEEALRSLQARWRRKARVVLQSATPLRTVRKTRIALHCVAVGHLRPEKDPRTLFAAMRLIPHELPITLRHIGAPLDAALARQAKALAKQDSRYRYSGALSHGLTRAAIQSAHLLVHPSAIEGGANVISEAVMSGTAIVASRIAGNIGLLGRSYPGYFEAGDASGLARRLVQAWKDVNYRKRLQKACTARKAALSPAGERRALRNLLAEMLS